MFQRILNPVFVNQPQNQVVYVFSNTYLVQHHAEFKSEPTAQMSFSDLYEIIRNNVSQSNFSALEIDLNYLNWTGYLENPKNRYDLNYLLFRYPFKHADNVERSVILHFLMLTRLYSDEILASILLTQIEYQGKPVRFLEYAHNIKSEQFFEMTLRKLYELTQSKKIPHKDFEEMLDNTFLSTLRSGDVDSFNSYLNKLKQIIPSEVPLMLERILKTYGSSVDWIVFSGQIAMLKAFKDALLNAFASQDEFEINDTAVNVKKPSFGREAALRLLSAGAKQELPFAKSYGKDHPIYISLERLAADPDQALGTIDWLAEQHTKKFKASAERKSEVTTFPQTLGLFKVTSSALESAFILEDAEKAYFLPKKLLESEDEEICEEKEARSHKTLAAATSV